MTERTQETIEQIAYERGVRDAAIERRRLREPVPIGDWADRMDKAIDSYRRCCVEIARPPACELLAEAYREGWLRVTPPVACAETTVPSALIVSAALVLGLLVVLIAGATG